ncbi:ABC transporter ATP-binding protein [Acinetobacter populi]|uniref:ABC transporter ATP-binding protein n=1 Tax=Acinetobacter populi TaxID=1582270 RepID=A0A1Z9Z1J5_9GAMM|nr:ABC transporter ATP-binding protein [Acinetobacter populi]OUY08358.1 ABC transporter ATP-binding protein [Acinetobacter populi]
MADIHHKTQRIHSLKEIYQQMLRSAGDEQASLRKAFLLMTLSAICQGIAFSCLYPIFLAMTTQQISNITFWLVVLTAFVLLSSVLRWKAQDYDYQGHAAQAQHVLRTNLGEKLRQIPLQLLSKKRAGEWNATIAGSADEVIAYTLTVVSIMLYALVVPITVGILSFFFDWHIALIILLIFPAIIPLYRWRKPAYDRGMQMMSKLNGELNAELVEYTQGLPVLKAANCVGDQTQRLYPMIDKVHMAQEIGHRKGGKPNLIVTSAIEVGLLIAIAIGLWLVLFGYSNAMYFIAMLVIIIRFAEPIAAFTSMTMFFSLLEAGYARIENMLNIQPFTTHTPTQLPTRFDIHFDQVSFQYEQDNDKSNHENQDWALHQINLHIPEKSLTGLVGHSGCGKTTLTRLIMRYADCQQGQVKIGGIDIKNMLPHELMSYISVVFQDVYLFDDSIMNNIKMAKEDATEAEIIAVAKRAQCHTFISQLPEGYQTRIGDIGGSLSGGERQRISIARALLKDAPIVILDEPTAALDTFSELAVQAAIDELVKDKTVIVIAHRLSTIIAASNIIVLEHGEVLEQGTHQELLDKQGKYAQLWQLQYASEALAIEPCS